MNILSNKWINKVGLLVCWFLLLVYTVIFMIWGGILILFFLLDLNIPL
ncbi:MAG TPA: hypothetical protein VNR38_12205 [Ureibacillus sp.]|nr:hypothetical protein [Ureibacillus sp.]